MNSEHPDPVDDLVPNHLSPLEVHVMKIGQTLGRLEGKIDKALEMDEHQIKITDDHEARIRNLEKSGWKQTGFVGGISAAVALLVNYIHKSGIFPT